MYSKNVPNGYGLSHIEVLNDIFSNIKKKKNDKKLKLKDAVSTVKLVHSIYASCEKNKPIKLKDNIVSTKLGYK